MPKVEAKCSFCTKNKDEVQRLITGKKIGNKKIPHICNECIDIGYHYIHQKIVPKQKSDTTVEWTPSKIKHAMDEYVVGQDLAKTTLSVAIYNHYKRTKYPIVDGVEISKTNIMMIGPSGSGKTLLASTVAKMLDLPIVVADATTLTEMGYVGKSVDNIFERLYKEAGNNLKKAQNGIVFIDEIDKKAKKDSPTGKDISGEGVQQSLLKAVEGDIIHLELGYGEKIEFNTENVLFIVSGAFIGIDQLISKRMQQGNGIGFSANVKDKNNTNIDEILVNVEADDLHEFGLTREFIGRFPSVVVFKSLDVQTIMKIMTEPKNNIIGQYKGLFKIDGVSLDFTEEYIEQIAKQSIDRKTGARGIRSMLEKTLLPLQFTLPNIRENGFKNVMVGKDGLITYNHGE